MNAVLKHRVAVEAQTWSNVPPRRSHVMYRGSCKCGWAGTWFSYRTNVESECPRGR